VAPLGDLQYAGRQGPTARDALKRHIAEALDREAWFLGMGDYIDFLSPSNRQRLRAAALYDTADEVIAAQAKALVAELYEDFLQPTTGRWLGLLEGHHFFEVRGETSDGWLADLLKAPLLGTSAFLKLDPAGVVLWAHHGVGNSVLPSGPLNKLYHTSHGWVGADVYLIGHTTKLSAARLSRPMPRWERRDLTHGDILLVNTGGFAKSSVVGHRYGGLPRGDYAEQKMLTPAPLTAPFVLIDGRRTDSWRVRVEV
jgi:hypothetical protein